MAGTFQRTGAPGTTRAVLPGNIISRSFVAETVLLDVNSGRYFKLDRTGGAMLEALLSQPTVAAAAAALAEEGWGSEEILRADLAKLGAELAGMGLLRLVGVAAGGGVLRARRRHAA